MFDTIDILNFKPKAREIEELMQLKTKEEIKERLREIRKENEHLQY